MSHSPRARQMSVQTKINLALLIVFFTTMVASLAFSVISERRLVLEVVEQQTKDAADSYFDSINTMMLTGTMAQRDVLREKILERPGVVDARIVRNEAITSVFGPGYDHQAPADELDQRALQDEAIVDIDRSSGHRILTVINPIHASKNYRGTDCLMCHMVPEDSVVGAVRISYSLEDLDRQVLRNLWTSALIQAALLVGGLAVIIYLVRRVVIVRVNALRRVMEDMTRNDDLSQVVSIQANDEVGAMGHAFNQMIAKFRSSLQAVAEVTGRLGQVSDQVSSVADDTLQQVVQQRMETEQVASAMHEMSATVQEVAGHAAQTAQASQNADSATREGVAVAARASEAIAMLIGEIENAAQVVGRVQADSSSISEVLGVITSIAEQTNLLALNAAIEAARAGEQGRGFAVVADEVRTLAARTQNSTGEIQQMIQRLHEAVADAVQAMEAARQRAGQSVGHVEETSQGLNSIAIEVTGINDMNLQIAAAAEEQSAVAEEINRNVANISAAADGTSRGATATHEQSEVLVELAAELRRLVSQFKL
ncbi:MAG: HAMP domain-containing protein [Gammaproteobacteria bacterium]|nr:HAMP domain-containing protein [Gammaproteobacteria bacterium]